MTIGGNAKRCTKCGEIKPLDEFHRDPSMPDGRASRCRDCRCEANRRRRAANPAATREADRRRHAAKPSTCATKEAARRRYAANPEPDREAKRRRHARNRNAVLDHYGRMCACCGSTERLTIDHVNGDGRKHREEIGQGSSRLYRWLIRNGLPDGFQTLCFRCNKSKADGTSCQLDHVKTVT